MHVKLGVKIVQSLVKALIIVVALILASLALTTFMNTHGTMPETPQKTPAKTPISGGIGVVKAYDREAFMYSIDYSGRTLMVTGSATLYAEPDRVYLSLAIETEEPVKDPVEAYSEVVLKAKKVIDELKGEEGVASIKTEYVNLNPLYDWSGGEKILKGYVASYSFKVEIDDLEKAGEIASKAVSLGVNRLYGLTFGLSEDKRKSLVNDTIEEAVNDAKAKAEKLAEALGVKIVGVKSVALGAPTTTAYYPLKYGVVEAAAIPPTPIETGKGIAVTVTVTVVYEISE